MKFMASLLMIIGCKIIMIGLAYVQNSSFTGLPIVNTDGSSTFPASVGASDQVPVSSSSTDFGYHLPITDFASQRDLVATQTQLYATQAQLNSSLGQLNALASQITTELKRFHRHSSEGISLAAAMTIVPPNPGDRFSVTLAGAGFDSQGGGSATGTYRITDRIMVFGGYARGATENLGKVGVSFSFNWVCR